MDQQQLSIFYKFVSENKIDMNEVMRLNTERIAKEQQQQQQRVSAAAIAVDTKRKQQIARLEKERSIAIENQREKLWNDRPTMASMGDIYSQMSATSALPDLSPLSDSGSAGDINFTGAVEEGEEDKVEVIGESAATCIADASTTDEDIFNYIFPTPTLESRPTQTAAVRPQGKSIDILKQAYNELEHDRLEEHVDKRNYR